MDMALGSCSSHCGECVSSHYGAWVPKHAMHACCTFQVPSGRRRVPEFPSKRDRTRTSSACLPSVNKKGFRCLCLNADKAQTSSTQDCATRSSAEEVAALLDCTTWTGVGPGMMDAVIKGALKAGKPVGGFKISKEAGEWTSLNIHPYLENHVYYTCRFFSARKHGLVDAAVRDCLSERTAFVALPGGIGTVDEIFEILTLLQLQRIGSKYPVPFLLMNYDGFYTKLLEFLSTCKVWGSIAEGEVEKLWTVCDNNKEALEYLADFYSIEEEASKF